MSFDPCWLGRPLTSGRTPPTESRADWVQLECTRGQRHRLPCRGRFTLSGAPRGVQGDDGGDRWARATRPKDLAAGHSRAKPEQTGPCAKRCINQILAVLVEPAGNRRMFIDQCPACGMRHKVEGWIRIA